MGEGLVLAVRVEPAAVIGGGGQVFRLGGGGQANSERQHQIGFVHGCTCEIGIPAFPQGH
jgi:hypothetical protein